MRRLATLSLSHLAALALSKPYTLTVIHTDDLHGHMAGRIASIALSVR